MPVVSSVSFQQVLLPLFCLPSLIFFPPGFEIFVRKQACKHVFIWSRLLQLAEAELNIHCVPSRWWNAPPLHFEHRLNLSVYFSDSLPWFSQLPPLLNIPCFLQLLFSSVISSSLSLSSLFLSLPFFWSPLSSLHLPIISLPLSPSIAAFSPITYLTPSSNHFHHSPSLSFPLRHSLIGTPYLLDPSLAVSIYYLFGTEAGQTERSGPLEDDSPNSRTVARCWILKPCVGKLIVSE